MTFEEKLNSLNPNQRLAVDSIEGPVMVIAGPGTGKTEILSLRIGNIIRETDTPPSGILCLTYTDAASSEMRHRLIEYIGPEAYKTQVFHTQIERFFNRSFVARTPQKSAPTVAAGTGHGAGGRERGAAADRQIVPAQAQKRPCVVEGAMGAQHNRIVPPADTQAGGASFGRTVAGHTGYFLCNRCRLVVAQLE